jgi:hypothetical protein
VSGENSAKFVKQVLSKYGGKEEEPPKQEEKPKEKEKEKEKK